jgi:Fuc2NAc and GlcNAc transferase
VGTVIAAVVTLLTLFPVRSHARTLGLVDAPNERSSHRVLTPRGGGVAIILGAAAALAFFGSLGELSAAWTLVGAAGLVGAVGLLDDRFGLPPILRLVAQLCIAAGLVATFGPLYTLPLPPPLNAPLPGPLLAWGLSLLWLSAVTNFFNFMDGIDGIAAAQAAAVCAGIVAAGWSPDAVLLALAVGGASIGFLFHNWPPARIFMGDAGSGFLGFALAGMPFLASPSRRSDALLALAVGMTLFLLDPLVTLFSRARAGKNIFQAHREHLYQQLVAPEEPAGRVTAGYTGAALLLALAGAFGYHNPPAAWMGCAAGVALFVVVWRHASVRRAHTRASGGISHG